MRRPPSADGLREREHEAEVFIDPTRPFTLEAPLATVAPSVSEPLPLLPLPAPKRSPIFGIVVAGLLFGGAIAFVGVGYKTLKERMVGPAGRRDDDGNGGELAADVDRGSSTGDRPGPATDDKNARSRERAVVFLACRKAFRVGTETRTFRSSPEPDGLRLDHRK